MTPDLDDDRQRALTVPCSYCHALAGQPCTRTDLAGETRPLGVFPAHLPRLKAAGVLHAPIDSRDLRRGD
jgi:hypothetical protein